MNTIGYRELESVAHSCGGSVDKRKFQYFHLLPVVHDVRSSCFREKLKSIQVGYFIYGGWSAWLSATISVMTLRYIEADLKLPTIPLCSFNVEYIVKKANEHEFIIRTAF